MMPRALAASILWTLLCSCTQWEWSRSRDVCSTLLSLQRGDAAATSNLFPTIFHPSDPIIPSALPASSLPINLPSSFDSSPASLCSLSFINSSLVQRAGAVLGAAVVNNVREAGKKSSDSSPRLTSSVFSALQRQQFSVLQFFGACFYTGCSGWLQLLVFWGWLFDGFPGFDKCILCVFSFEACFSRMESVVKYKVLLLCYPALQGPVCKTGSCFFPQHIFRHIVIASCHWDIRGSLWRLHSQMGQFAWMIVIDLIPLNEANYSKINVTAY